MHRKIFTLAILLLPIFFFPANAQKLGLKVGMNVGGSKIYHNSDYKSTVFNNLFEYTKELFATEGIDYTWEQFARANKLKSSFMQPRFGFSAHLTYSDWPIFLMGEAMSSTSSYENMAFSGTFGLGKDFAIGDNIGLFITCLGGYKYVYDKGFGSKTLINGVGDKSLRKELETFFYSEQPIGTKWGNLFTLRLGIGKALGDAEKLTVGIEGYGELDLTDKTSRQSRMTNVGAHVYARFKLLEKRGQDPFYPNPAGGRSK